MSNPKIKAIIFLERNYLSYLQERAQAILTLSFPATVIRDLEVITPEELDKQIKTFIDANKLIPANITIILSDNTLFIKDFPLTQVNIEDATQEFLDTIPFETVTTKTYKLDKINRVVAANSDIHTYIKESFEKYGFVIESVVPGFIAHGVSLSSGINLQIGKLLLSQTSVLKQENLLELQILQETIQQDEKKDFIHKSKNKRAVLLLGVFGLLVFALFVLIYINFFVKSATPKLPQARIIPPQEASPSPSLTLEPAAISAASENAQLTLTAQILNGSGVVGQAQIIKAELEKIGIGTVLTGNSTGTSSSTVVIFKESVDSQTRVKILTALRTLFETVSSQENNESQYDVLITTGKVLITPTPISQ